MSDDLTQETVLSNDEAHALLDAIRERAATHPVEPADLTSPERPLREALAHADRCASMLADAVRRILLRLGAGPCATEAEPAEIAPYQTVRAGVERGSVVGVLRGDDDGEALLVLDAPIVAALLSRRMGAPLDLEQTEQDLRSELSALDRRVVEPGVAALAEAFSRSWCDDPRALVLHRIVGDPGELPSVPQFEPMLRIAVRVAPAGSPGGRLALALPATAVRTATPGPDGKPPARATRGERDRIGEHLRETPVRVVAVLGSARSSVREVLSLEVGDILRLDGVPGAPIDVCVDGRALLRGLPVLKHGNVAIQVSERR